MQTQNNKLSFKNQDLYVGIDIHKKQWTISITHMNRTIHKKTVIDPLAKTLLTFLNRRYPEGNYHAVYEAGFCGFQAARDLNELGVNCIVTHPADIPTKQKERLNKNDRVDARKLSRSLSSHDLEGIYIPDKISEEYRYLSRYRYSLIKDQTRMKNRIKSALYQFGIKMPLEYEDRRWSGQFIDWLSGIRFETEYAQYAFDDQISQLIQMRLRLTQTLMKMKTMVSTVAPMSPVYRYLLSVPGIGPITAVALLTEIIDIHRFKKTDQLVSFVGLAPCVRSSDEKEKMHGITPRHNKHLRSMLIEAAWKAAGVDPVLTMKFGQLCRRMPKNKAIVRIAKMLISRIHYVWKNQTAYVEGVLK
jgi:transposase